MERQEFIEGINQLNRQIKASQEMDKEVVSDDDAAKAIIIVKNMKINEIGDAFLFAAALNTLNTWVKQDKQNKKSVGYFFKGTAEGLCQHLMSHEDPDIDLEIQQDNGMPLLVTKFGDMQFSFHQIDPGENGAKFTAKDLENPRIAWDGIRKQRCANTLFNFALENQFGRTNQMMDGSSFEKGLKEQMELFQSGQKTLSDLKRGVYWPDVEKQEKRPGRKERARMSDIARTRSYPLRHKPAATLYENDLKTFINELENRSFIQFLQKTFEEGFGCSLNAAQVCNLKYCLETVLAVLKQCPAPEEVGVSLEYVREKDDENFILMLVSMDEAGKLYISATHLCGWDTLKLNENQLVEYTDDGMDYSMLSFHPSRKILAFRSYITRGLEDESRFHFDPCVYLYDAAQQNEGFPEAEEEEMQKAAPMFYAIEKKELADYLSESFSHGSGRQALKKLRVMFADGETTIENGRSYEQTYVLRALSEIITKGEKFLYLIDGRARTGKATAVKVAMEYLTNQGKTVFTVHKLEDIAAIPEGAALVYYEEVVPEEIDYDKFPCNVLSYDPYLKTREELQAIRLLRMDAQSDGVKVYSTSFHTAVGFKDYGAGNNWLIRHFGLGLIQNQEWNSREYPILIRENPEQFSKEEGIAHVVIPASVTYDEEEQVIDFGEDCSRADLYRSFASGQRGVEMVIEDEALRNMIQQELDEARNRYQWISRYMQGGQRKEDIDRATSEVFSNSVVRNKYESLARQYLGEDAWKKLTEESRNWILSAMLAYHDMKNYDQLLDFSGVVLQVCKALENELSIRFVTQYEDWLKKTYGEEYMQHLPEALKDTFGDVVKPLTARRMTMGSIPYIMGLDRDGRIENQKDYDTFVRYAREQLLADPDSVRENIRKIAHIVEHIRKLYRNPAAHKDSIDLLLARECLDYCVSDGRKLGMLMDLMKK